MGGNVSPGAGDAALGGGEAMGGSGISCSKLDTFNTVDGWTQDSKFTLLCHCRLDLAQAWPSYGHIDQITGRPPQRPIGLAQVENPSPQLLQVLRDFS